MRDVRTPRSALLFIAAVGIVFGCAESNGAERPTISRSAAAAPTATKASEDRDLKEVSSYKLTMDAVRKFAQASRTMKQLEKQRSNAEQDAADDANDADDADDADADSADADDSKSLADTEAKLASMPEARKAIEGAGLSVHEYVVMTFALLQSGVAAYAIEQGADPAKIARDAGIHPANVTFYKEHKAEIDALTAGMK
jgi:hypothetical protein